MTTRSRFHLSFAALLLFTAAVISPAFAETKSNFVFTVVGSTSTNSTEILPEISGGSLRAHIRIWFTNSFYIAFGEAASTNLQPIIVQSGSYAPWNEDDPNCWQGRINARALGTNSFRGGGVVTYK